MVMVSGVKIEIILQKTLLTFLSDQRKGSEYTKAGRKHDGGCEQQAKQDLNYAFFEVQIKQTGSKGAGPGSGPGNRNSNKK